MSHMVFIIEDNPEEADQIKEALTNGDEFEVHTLTWPWQLINKLKMTRSGYSPKNTAVISGLYFPAYWDLSPKRPYHKKPHYNSPIDPDILKEMALDCIHNYLKELVQDYHFSLIVYSNLFDALEIYGSSEASHNIVAELKAIGVLEEYIIRKTRSGSTNSIEIEQIKACIRKILGEKP